MKQVEYLGNTFNVDDEALEDVEIFEEMVDVQNGNIARTLHLIKAIIGEDGYEALKDSLRDGNGRARTAEVFQGFTDIMTAAGEDKKK